LQEVGQDKLALINTTKMQEPFSLRPLLDAVGGMTISILLLLIPFLVLL